MEGTALQTFLENAGTVITNILSWAGDVLTFIMSNPLTLVPAVLFLFGSVVITVRAFTR